MTLKGAVLLVVAIVILVGATGGDASAASIGNAVGAAFHWVQVAVNGALGSGAGSGGR